MSLGAEIQGDPRLDRRGLRDAAVHGLRWTALARIVAEVSGLAASVVLARLIPPEEFGHAAVPMVLPVLSVVLTYQGFGSVLVQRKEITKDLERAAMSMSVVVGVSLSVLLWWASLDLLASLFGDRTGRLIGLVSPVFFISSLSVVSRAKLQRKLDFRTLGMIEAASIGLGMIVAVATAFAGLEAEAILAGMLTTSLLSTLFLLAVARPPSPFASFQPGDARIVASFGSAASLASVTTVCRRNVDYAILAVKLGAADVGYYWRAFQVGAEYQYKFSGLTQRLAFPLFSRTEDETDVRTLRSRVVKANVLVTFPLLGLFIALAPLIIPSVYGSQWQEAVVPAQILATVGMSLAIMSGTEQLVLSHGRPDMLARFNLVFLVALTVVVLAAAPHGLTLVCVTVALTYLTFVVAGQAIMVGRLSGISLRELADDVLPAACATGASLLVGVVVGTLVQPAGELAQFVAVATSGLFAYTFILRRMFRDAWEESVQMMSTVMRRSPKVVAA